MCPTHATLSLSSLQPPTTQYTIHYNNNNNKRNINSPKMSWEIAGSVFFFLSNFYSKLGAARCVVIKKREKKKFLFYFMVLLFVSKSRFSFFSYFFPTSPLSLIYVYFFFFPMNEFNCIQLGPRESFVKIKMKKKFGVCRGQKKDEFIYSANFLFMPLFFFLHFTRFFFTLDGYQIVCEWTH